MYRKKLMRVCLTGVMVVSIATANVAPVFAAEPVEKVETESDSWDSISGEINFRDTDNNESIFVQFNNEKVEDYRWGDDPKDTYEVLPAETVKKYLPEGYELVEGIYSVAGGETQDSYFVYAEVKKVLVEETQDVKINYYDEAAGKQVAEVPVQVSIDTSCVNMAILTRYLPEGYTLEGSDCIIRDGYVYVSVAPAEEVQNVKINYYDEAAKKQVAEVPVQVSIDTSCVNMAILTRYLPEGYTIEGTDCIIRDGYVYVSVAPAEEVQNVKINYYDEDAEKQVAEVPVQVSIDTSCVNMAILTRYMPEGYALVSSDCIIRDGYVYVSVKKDVEIREAVLHITFETPNGEVVTTETVTAEGADGEDAVFRLGVDFNLPTGYKLSNDRDQVTEITIPFGSTGGHTMVVEKGDLSSIVKIQFVDAENNDEVVAGGDYFVDGDGDGIFHTREITEWVPEGYELQEVGDFQVELYKETPLQLSVTKIKEDKPETPDPEEPNKPEKPEDPDKEDTNNKDDKKEDTKKEDKKKNSPKTGDETSAAAAALPAGVSLAAILAVLVKKFK
ncbi:hypothetical protein [Mediterraneibacter gnavus]|jgi:hypothetical protein|uniref:hypothetical protein n=1 Tax=Mediterraneibacter gnavus TaxID=33038 RepID=UPI000E91B4BC|nr:hypothetical protein [Mediterraneibacter gnavus]HBJ44652.1 hypothetical protein [Ruminococcus sp.]